jgi:polyhydroxyalkanoate synthesis regulator phasin
METRWPEVFERVWSQALVAVSAAEDEASKVVSRVAEVATLSQEEVRRHVRELAERLSTQRRELERRVEDGVQRGVAHLVIPRREQLQDVERRLEKIAERMDALEKR